MFAVCKNKIKLVKFLISAGASLDLQDFVERTALTLALEKGLTEIAEELLKAGAKVNPIDEQWMTDELRYH